MHNPCCKITLLESYNKEKRDFKCYYDRNHHDFSLLAKDTNQMNDSELMFKYNQFDTGNNACESFYSFTDE